MTLLSSVSIALVCSGFLHAQIDLRQVVPANKPVHVIAFGDFGTGGNNQTDTARAIERRHREKPFDLGVTVGDNFYRCGVRSVRDNKWITRWETLYTPLGIRFYPTLGNHDYGHPPAMCIGFGASPQAEVDRTQYSKSWTMPARYYTFTAGPVRFVAIDTEGWSQEQLEWIRITLETSKNEPGIRWRIVYGHHPIISSGFHANERRIGRLRQELLPVLKAANVDIYLCGHDHNLERLRLDGIDMLVSGGGGAKLRGAKHPKPESSFTSGSHGFLDLAISSDRLEAQFYDTNLHALESSPLVRVR